MVATSGAGWQLAPSLVALVNETDLLYPNRSTASDGSIGDLAHASRKSDHNPANSFVHAVDITHDPAHGFNAWKVANEFRARADQRIQYLVSNDGTGDVIWNPDVAHQWRPQVGNNHANHLHVSIRHTDPARSDVRSWYHNGVEEFHVTDADKLTIRAIVAEEIEKYHASTKGHQQHRNAEIDALDNPDSTFYKRWSSLVKKASV